MTNYYFSSIMQPFGFGKYRKMTLEEVLKLNPSYVYWCVWNVQGFHITEHALYEISKFFPKFIISSEFMQRNLFALKCKEEDCEYYDDYENDSFYEEAPTYSRYNGTYAQDVMGYSDDDIDTIFDGEPDAYWNID